MARKGENIFKRKDGRWEGRYIKWYENGRAVYGYVFGRSYSEAKRKKSEAMAGQSSFPKSVRTFSDQPFMREVAYQWLDGLKTIRRKSTVAKYEGQLRNHILPEFGDKRIDEISNNDIISFSQKLLEKGKKPRTVADIISRMRTIRKFSLLHGYSVKFISDCTEIPQTFEKVRVLSLEEEKRLVAYLKENLNPSNLGILISLFTGIRLGELCALKWSDFCLESQEFQVFKTMQRLPNPDRTTTRKTHIEIGAPKSPCSIRTIPLPEKLMEYIQSAYCRDAYILSGQRCSFIEPRTMENRFKAVLKKCGLQETKFHTLRHTFATRCVEAGFDVKTLGEILGHAGVHITLNRYVHPSMRTKHENMCKLNELL